MFPRALARRLLAPPLAGRARLFVALSALAFGACECDEQINRLSGTVVVTPGTLDFGRVAVGTAKTLPLSLENVGTFDLRVQGYEVDGPFEVVAPEELRLVVNTSTSIEVRFLPRATGALQGNLRILTDDPESPEVDVPLVGEGIEASILVEPARVDFGEILRAEGAMPGMAQVTLTNRGTDAFELLSVTARDDQGGAFAVDAGQALGTFAPGASSSVQVSFSPRLRSASAGALLIETTAPDGRTIEVPLAGTGVGPQMEVCSTSGDGSEACTDRGENPRVDVGGIDLGQTSMGRVRVRNVGDRPLSVELSQLGMGSPELTLSPDPTGLAPFVVMPSGQWDLDVGYRPTDFAFDAVNLAFVSDDPDRRTQTVLVEARVPKPVVNAIPRSMTFRLTGNGANESIASLRVVNCGERPLRLEAAPALTSGANAFSLRDAPAAGTMIMPGDCTRDAPNALMRVVFSPGRVGSFSGAIEIRTNDPLNPTLEVTLAGARN